MKALSIKQPWAWLICAGYKDIENRTFDAPRCGRIYVHTGKIMDDTGWEFIKERLSPEMWKRIWNTEFINNLPLGAIVGEVDIAWVTLGGSYKSPWFVGPLGYVMKNPKLYEMHIHYKGQLEFIEVNLVSK